MTTRVCPRCNIRKNIEEFARPQLQLITDGTNSYCECAHVPMLYAHLACPLLGH